MRKRMTMWVSVVLVIMMLLSLTGCGGYRVGGKALEEIDVEERKLAESIYEKVMVVFREGSVENLNSLSYSDKVTYEEAWKEWEEMKAAYGEYQGYTVDTVYLYGEENVIVGYVNLENSRIGVDVKINSKGLLCQMEIYLPDEEAEALMTMPDAIEEVPVVIGEGTDYPLDGIITMPKGALESGETYPAAVLIHGTGANDKDMTAGSTRMFRDIAWGLAEQGIITIRYDKRTSIYAEEMISYPSEENLDIDWDIIDDAVLATEMLRNVSAVDPDNVYAIGHSLGGLVMPRIDENGGQYTGYVLMAVPDSTWQDAAFQQYLNYGLANMDTDDIYYACSFLESQKKDIDSKLDTYSDDELMKENLLGMPAMYWKNLNEMDYVEAYTNTDKPMLILQGEEDYQIRADQNFEGWQKLLEGHSNVSMKQYEGLNHLFMVSQGCFMGSSMEYAMPNYVEDTVIADIAAYIG